MSRPSEQCHGGPEQCHGPQSNVPAHTAARLAHRHPLAHGGGHPWHTAGGAGLGRSGRGLRGGSAGEGGRGRRSLEFRSRPKDSMTALPENNF